MSSYRFCRTDDIDLLVDALNRCWAPNAPGEPLTTAAIFKRSIRDLQVWCSSCMVAFTGSDPVGILIGAKRASGTLIHRIAVHPDHQRQGHGRHLLTSLSSKLAILGPPRLVAEVPETRSPACEVFSASGYIQEALLTDYVLEVGRLGDGTRESGVGASTSGAGANELGVGVWELGVDLSHRFVIPVTVDDLAANGLLREADAQVCWSRAVESVTARKDGIAGLAVASDERIEAYVLYSAQGSTADVVSLRTFVEDDGARLAHLLTRLTAQGLTAVRFPKVHPSEISKELLETLGFRPAGAHRLYAAKARSA